MILKMPVSSLVPSSLLGRDLVTVLYTPLSHTAKNYLVNVTSPSGWSSFRVIELYEDNVIPFHHSLTIQPSFIKKQRASTDTCLLANKHSYHFLWSTCWLLPLLWVSSSVTPSTIPSGFIKNKELPQTSVCSSSLQANRV